MSNEPFSILTVLTSFLSFIVGIWGAAHLQDRDLRRRHLGIVRALAAEASRIRSELGAAGPHYVPIAVGGATAVIPTVGPWVFTVLTDIAATSPDIVSAFLRLDRDLENVRAFSKTEDRALARLQSAAEVRQRTAAAAEAVKDVDQLAPAMIQAFAAERKEEEAKAGVDVASFSASNVFKNAIASLGQLDDLLTRLDKALTSSPITHLPWRKL